MVNRFSCLCAFFVIDVLSGVPIIFEIFVSFVVDELSFSGLSKNGIVVDFD